jgi:hypothetical protein
MPAHKVEENLWDVLLRVGKRDVQALFDSHGRGDLRPSLTLPNGDEVNRLKKTRSCRSRLTQQLHQFLPSHPIGRCRPNDHAERKPQKKIQDAKTKPSFLIKPHSSMLQIAHASAREESGNTDWLDYGIVCVAITLSSRTIF